MRKKTKKLEEAQYSLTDSVIESIQDKKGENIVHLDLSSLNDAATDHFIICHADSTTQVRAIANHIVENVFELTGMKPLGKEGFENCEWVLVDYMNVVVHVFYRETRNFYQLEELWHDAQVKKVS